MHRQFHPLAMKKTEAILVLSLPYHVNFSVKTTKSIQVIFVPERSTLCVDVVNITKITSVFLIALGLRLPNIY